MTIEEHQPAESFGVSDRKSRKFFWRRESDANRNSNGCSSDVINEANDYESGNTRNDSGSHDYCCIMINPFDVVWGVLELASYILPF